MTLASLLELSSRTALVTGGSKGIGKAIARGLAEAGADVCITARHADELEAATREIGAGLDVRVAWRVCDMADRAEVDAMADWVLGEFGKVDILFNNAGTNQPQTLVETTDESWDRVLEINFTSCMRLARKLTPGMIERGWGRIIHLSSVMAVASNSGRGNYSGTKAALSAMSRAHALELGPHGITVNCLAPGPIATELPMSLLNDEQKKRFSERTAVKRWGETQDLVGPALLLASDAGAYITGTTLLVEGGMLCRTFD
ncbi:SDR family NAD(P)-dependent oxidoreductase [Blastopirellula retiformator]|uniref:3-oxoacyl-[acyl-carrier-protein] reductase FabG n=1 Tax=Blastopirellula retiformator TaxID=2527970 RepID=A0A5C5V224_9BACT|nr:SDR family NAD(P)-dependent oxidoreductase [Blastopirellula retiformator]TWT32020.1 3-oxoacyl-[acyl-carrier-protein] reductase FabG [Blastopirellula retiformator]